MKNIYSASDLHDAISTLEQKRNIQQAELEQEVADVLESLKPSNIIKNSVHNIFSSAETKSNILNSAIGLGSGLLSKKLLVGPATSVFKKAIGAAVQFGVAGLIAKNAEAIKSKGSQLISKIFSRKSKYPEWTE